MSAAPHPVGEVLGYQDRLPLSWRAARGDDPSPAELQDEAHRVLLTCGMLEETRRRRDNDEETVEIELDRLHMKVNMVLDMLGSLLAAQQRRPAPVPLWLSGQGVLWLQELDGVTPGTDGIITLHLHRALPRPLVLPARIQHAGGGEVSALFKDLSGPCQSELERHVFLRHRRAVAESRSPSSR